MVKQRITLYVSQTTWRAFRALCVRAGVSASAVVAAMMDDPEMVGRCVGRLKHAETSQNAAKRGKMQ